MAAAAPAEGADPADELCPPDVIFTRDTELAAFLSGPQLPANVQVADGRVHVTFKNEAKVKDPGYQVHLWNGKPSASAENQQWEVLAG